MPETTIVVPAYNAERYLAETLDSILAQTVADWELIIVDDGSKDGTAAIARAYVAKDARVRLVQQENQGLPGARNGGLAEADPNSRFVIFPDADDLMEPDALATLLAAQRAHPDALVVYGYARFIDGESRPLDESQVEAHFTRRLRLDGVEPVPDALDAPTTFESLFFQNNIQTSGLALFPRSTFARVGLYDRELRSNADWHMWLRVALHGKIALVPRVVLAYRRHPNNMSRVSEVMRRTRLRMQVKTLQLEQITPAHRRAALRVHLHCHGDYLARFSLWRGLLERLRCQAPLTDADRELMASDETPPLLWMVFARQTPLIQALVDACLAAPAEQKPDRVGAEQRDALDAGLAFLNNQEAELRRWLMGKLLTRRRFAAALKNVLNSLRLQWQTARTARRKY